MPGRQTVPIPFGPGLERETGIMAVRPGSMEDVRNVLFRRGKLVLRKGHQSTLTFTDKNGTAVTHILAGQMLLGERTGVVATYQGDSGASAYGDVDVHLLDGNATDQIRLATWFNTSDLGLDPANVPIVSMADTYNRCFMAHDEFRIKARAPTVYYDPFRGPGLQTLEADLAGTGSASPIRFRGVVEYLSYLVGWGYGTSQDDRAELVRVSLPADPTSFRPEHYFIAGARNDPTIACQPAGNVLAVFKEAESYKITGFSRDTFGIEPLDARHGCIAPRLATSVGNLCYFWSQDGPRVTDGRSTEDIAEDLELDAFEPSSLVSPGETVQGWADYINAEDVVVFAFNRRIYVLSLHNRDQPRWSYWTLPFDQFCGFQLYSTGVGDPDVSAPTGQPEFNQDLSSPERYQIHPEWDNEGQDGDEKVEIWYRFINNLVSSWRMNSDGDGDGVVDGFASNSDSGITPNFSFQGSVTPKSQAIEITGSTAAGHAWVQQTIASVEAGKDYDIHAETRVVNASGTFAGTIHGRWLDGSDTELGTFTIGPFTPTAEYERRFSRQVTAPANTAKLELRLRATAQASGDTGQINYRLTVVAPRDEHGSWAQQTVPVATGSPQEQIIGTADEQLQRGAIYEVGLRYRRAGIFYTNGYTANDPESWPDESLGLGVTSLVGSSETAVQIHEAWWEPDKHRVFYSMPEELVDDLLNLDTFGEAGVRVYRKDSTTGGDFVQVREVLFSTTSGVPDQALISPVGGGSVFDRDIPEAPAGREMFFVPVTIPDTIVGEYVEYQIQPFIIAEEGQKSAAFETWTGPMERPSNLTVYDTGTTTWAAEWVNELITSHLWQDAELSTEIWAKNITQGESSFSEVGSVLFSAANPQLFDSGAGTSGDEIEVKVRHQWAALNRLNDYTDFSETVTVNLP